MSINRQKPGTDPLENVVRLAAWQLKQHGAPVTREALFQQLGTVEVEDLIPVVDRVLGQVREVVKM